MRVREMDVLSAAMLARDPRRTEHIKLHGGLNGPLAAMDEVSKTGATRLSFSHEAAGGRFRAARRLGTAQALHRALRDAHFRVAADWSRSLTRMAAGVRTARARAAIGSTTRRAPDRRARERGLVIECTPREKDDPRDLGKLSPSSGSPFTARPTRGRSRPRGSRAR
jgi:hypothetical protein